MPAPQAQTSQADAAAQPQAGNTPSTTSQADETETLTPADLRAALAEARKEAAGNRTKLRAFEKAEQDRTAATLTETEKRDARIRELEESLTNHERRARDYALRDAIAAHVARDDFPALPVATGDRLLRLLDPDAVEWDGETPKNVGALLTGLARTDPYLFQPKARRPGAADAGGGGRSVSNSDMNALIRGHRG